MALTKADEKEIRLIAHRLIWRAEFDHKKPPTQAQALKQARENYRRMYPQKYEKAKSPRITPKFRKLK